MDLPRSILKSILIINVSCKISSNNSLEGASHEGAEWLFFLIKYYVHSIMENLLDKPNSNVYIF
jgi:hypothetical protein